MTNNEWIEMKGWLSNVQKTEPDALLYDIVLQFMNEFHLNPEEAGKIIARWILEVT